MDLQQIEHCREVELAQMQLDMVHYRQRFAFSQMQRYPFYRFNLQFAAGEPA